MHSLSLKLFVDFDDFKSRHARPGQVSFDAGEFPVSLNFGDQQHVLGPQGDQSLHRRPYTFFNEPRPPPVRLNPHPDMQKRWWNSDHRSRSTHRSTNIKFIPSDRRDQQGEDRTPVEVEEIDPVAIAGGIKVKISSFVDGGGANFVLRQVGQLIYDRSEDVIEEIEKQVDPQDIVMSVNPTLTNYDAEDGGVWWGLLFVRRM
ncbi:hypothetical protein L2E82_01834 [Cichorium intybus]|uniref:Uncharacterized protein n=1 Tax=Cichorium intybus TaxID=13427 RepID=A0ACB9H0H2_CICIN|nr:hypothetical protein L2E82_01834 [Cichorium intybus]